MFCHVLGLPSSVLKFPLQQSTLDTFSYHTSDNGIASDYPKTITSNFIYGKPPSNMS